MSLHMYQAFLKVCVSAHTHTQKKKLEKADLLGPFY